MGLFKGIKQSKERQKAKAFYETAFNLPDGTRETRKLRSVLGNRTSAFIDMTFIDGAKQTEAYIEAMNASGATRQKNLQLPAIERFGPSVAMYGFISLRATAISILPLVPSINRASSHQQGYLRSPIRLPLRFPRHSCSIIRSHRCNF